jgi:hypothetical protein
MVVDVSETPFRVGVGAVAALLAVGLFRVRLCHEVTAPPLPPKPAPKRISAVEASRTIERNPQFYADFLARDSRAYRVEPAATPESMSKVLPYHRETPGATLDPADKKHDGDHAEALGLALSIEVEAIKGTPNRQMVLTIENTTDQYLAYRVQTRPSKGTRPCHDKRDLSHNAVALAPHERIRRSECLWNKGWTLSVESVETMELPALSYQYVSLLPANLVGLEARTARGHHSASGEGLCNLFQSAEVDRGMEGGVIGWRDLIDFYARHRCKTYSFPASYRAFRRDGELALPAAQGGG